LKQQEPDRPYSGKLPFRTTPERHRRIAQAARVAGKSINAWMDEALVTAADATLAAGEHGNDISSLLKPITG
jgi:predicted HicB family RNase H-like nuclease